jgi:hypothetical protein
MALLPGTRLGAYEIVGLIGAGGMGEVYRAPDHPWKAPATRNLEQSLTLSVPGTYGDPLPVRRPGRRCKRRPDSLDQNSGYEPRCGRRRTT